MWIRRLYKAYTLQTAGAGAKPKSAVENLLGEHSALVNLDSLVDNKRTAGPPAKNPFAEQPNPFQAAAAPKPSMNQLRGGNQVSRAES